jgi:thiamine kinase-like enzyme
MKGPIAVESVRVSDHPAFRAWIQLGGQCRPVTIERWRDEISIKPAIYRLVFASPRQPAVFAKRYRTAELAFERRVYEEVLADLPLTTPQYYGFHEDAAASGWLFIEDVGTQRFSARDPEHRVLAGRWLGRMHRLAADLPAATRLPDAGPGRYLGHLRAARAKIRNSAGNPGLTAECSGLLKQVLELQDVLESRWDKIETACEGMPATLVHGDFQPKNVRTRGDDAALALYPIDWEMAGFGIPAVDLTPGRGPGLTMHVDPHAYEAEMRERWPALDAARVQTLSMLGHIFLMLASIEWASEDLIFESPRYLLEPVSSIRIYAAKLCVALAAAQEWLA